MKPTVTLTITSGPLKGRRLVFDEPTVLRVGRASDCDLAVLSHDDYMNVSRHHGWFDIEPPSVRVFDSGSLNGTYVNGANVSESRNTEIASAHTAPGDLLDGDDVRMGNLVFQVGVRVPDFPTDEVVHAESKLAACTY